MRGFPLVLLAACADVGNLGPREQLVISTLADDNYVWAQRDPDIVADKLVKMQRSPYIWLRGTAAVFWRDIMDPGEARPATAFGSPASSRVLLVADPHPENAGTFQAADGTMVIDWNDFDSAGYGPYEGDLRRMIAGLIIAADDPTITDDIARNAATGYAQQIAALAAGKPVVPVGVGAEPYFDKIIAKAQANAAAGKTIDEIAPVVADGVRAIAFGDVEPVAADGVIENRLAPVGADAAVWIDEAIAAWRTHVPGELGAVKLRARQYGSGVESYPTLRYEVVLEGPTAAIDDDLVVELKEEREGLVIANVPILDVAPWSSPAARDVDAAHHLQALPEEDLLLGVGDVAPLSIVVHHETDYQKGVNADDLAALAAGSDAKRDQLRALATRFGQMLATSHGKAPTADGVPGWSVIAPLIAGQTDAFVAEVMALSEADAAQVAADFASLQGVDLAPLVLPQVAR